MANVTISSDRYTIDSLYQWDKDQVLQIYGLSLASIPEIHFTNASMGGALVRQATKDDAGVISVEVPNSLLQKPYKITVYVCTYEGDAFKTLYSMVIPVEARNKPTDYTIEVTDGEVYSFNALENKIDNAVAEFLEKYNDFNTKYEEQSEIIKKVVSATATVKETDDGAVITITDRNGTTTATVKHGENGTNGNNGTDYILTDDDKTEIAQEAAALIDTELLTIIGEVS